MPLFICRASQDARLEPAPRSRLFLACVALLIALAASANIYVRDAQLQPRHLGDPSTLIFDTATFSTANAPYFLRHAVSIQNGKPLASVYAGRSYPNNLTTASEPSAGIKLRNRPLLSVILAGLATGDEPANLLTAGNLGLVITAALTVVAISICFRAARYWAQGAIAGLGGGLSAAYLMRSSAGRIDTD